MLQNNNGKIILKKNCRTEKRCEKEEKKLLCISKTEDKNTFETVLCFFEEKNLCRFNPLHICCTTTTTVRLSREELGE